MSSEAKTILVVDDNPMTARWVGYLVQQIGFDAVLAADANQALACLAEQPFVAVISDVEMPDMNGFELLQNVRRFDPQMPVALMSVAFSNELREAACAWGALGLLEKPVNLDSLSSVLGTDSDVLADDDTARPVPAAT